MSGPYINNNNHKTSSIIITIITVIVIIIIVAVVVVDDDTYYWVYLSTDHIFEVYYMVRQVLLQSATEETSRRSSWCSKPILCSGSWIPFLCKRFLLFQ